MPLRASPDPPCHECIPLLITAPVKLLTHAMLMFQNECLGELSYEATPAVILMAGILVSFLAEHSVQQILLWRSAKKQRSLGIVGDAEISAELVNVAILEAGIIFHSLRRSSTATLRHSRRVLTWPWL